MTPWGFSGLRLVSSLCHVLPDVHARLSHGGRPVLEVTTGPSPVTGVRTVTPCQFRAATAQAWKHHRAGRRLCFLGLHEGEDPTVEVATAGRASVTPGPVYRIDSGDGAVHAVFTTLEVPDVAVLLAAAVIEGHPSTGAVELETHRDHATEVTAVTARGGDDDTARRVLRELLVACARRELDAELRQVEAQRTW